MAIDLADTARQIRERVEQRSLVHAPSLRDTHHVIVMCDPRTVEPAPYEGDPRSQPDGCMRLARQPHGAHPILATDRKNQREHRRMKMKMLVRVHVIERQSGS